MNKTLQVSSLQIRQISQLITCIPHPLYSKEALIIRKTSRLKDRLNLLKLRPDNICGQVKKINTQDKYYMSGFMKMGLKNWTPNLDFNELLGLL